ncbi:MAG: hypothetical protein WA941_01310 [Nitrososphaeraceae archaeon]
MNNTGVANPGNYQSDDEEAYFSFGKKAFSESIDTIKNFIQLMIPLTTGLITTYFALLEFLGIDTAVKANIGSWPLIEPALIMVMSLGIFIIASFPVPWPLAVGDYASIKGYRNAAIIWKYSCAAIGAILFLIAMVKMIFLVIGFVG